MFERTTSFVLNKSLEDVVTSMGYVAQNADKLDPQVTVNTSGGGTEFSIIQKQEFFSPIALTASSAKGTLQVHSDGVQVDVAITGLVTTGTLFFNIALPVIVLFNFIVGTTYLNIIVPYSWFIYVIMIGLIGGLAYSLYSAHLRFREQMDRFFGTKWHQ